MANLSAKQRLFIAHYCDCWNATDAAERAGYGGTRATRASLAVTGSENLRNPKIAAAIKERIEQIYPAGKVIQGLADEADASMEDFFTIAEEEVVLFEEVTIFGKAVKTRRETVMRPVARLDVRKGIEAGKGHLIKKYSLNERGVALELHDAHAAKVQLGKYHGLFKEKVEHSGPDGGDIPVKVLRGVSMDDL